jgi:hypothetical protein
MEKIVTDFFGIFFLLRNSKTQTDITDNCFKKAETGNFETLNFQTKLILNFQVIKLKI